MSGYELFGTTFSLTELIFIVAVINTLVGHVVDLIIVMLIRG